MQGQECHASGPPRHFWIVSRPLDRSDDGSVVTGERCQSKHQRNRSHITSILGGGGGNPNAEDINDKLREGDRGDMGEGVKNWITLLMSDVNAVIDGSVTKSGG